MANKTDMDKLDQCLSILDTTDLGLSMVWLWTWSTIKEFFAGDDYDQLVSEDEAWELLCKAVESGDGFTLEYGADDHYEAVREWMLDQGLMVNWDDVEEVLDGND
jgi:hypothetical protein